jgi:type I restriction enzyme S subunit
MNPLFDQFEALVRTPEDVQKLEESILQWAVMGKLVPQDPNDEPAEKLLKRIAIEKQRLVDAGQIKNRKSLPSISGVEKTYSIPDSWCFCRIGNICHDWGQKKPTEKFSYIDIAAIDNKNGKIRSDLQIIDPNHAPSRARKLVRKGSIIYSTVRPYLLNIAVIDQNFSPEPIVSTAFCVLHPYKHINNHYLYLFLRSNIFTKYVEEKMVGAAYPAINDKNFKLGVVPLPPLAEQKRIVAKVDQLFAQTRELAKRLEKSQKQSRKLSQSAFHHLREANEPEDFNQRWAFVRDHFEQLTTTSADIADLRQTVLQLAVKGKLVPQDPNDEPASELLKRITAEKQRLVDAGEIKKSKPLPPIKEEEKPFELPKGWVWCRLGELARKTHYGYTAKADQKIESCKLLRITDIQNDHVNWNTVPGCVISKNDLPKYKLGIGDILIARTGGTVGKSFLINDVNNVSVFASYLIRVQLIKDINVKYVKIFLNTLLYWEQLIDKSKGTGQPNVNATSLKSMILPIPPLAEQKRIVQKVEEMLSLCNYLNSGLNDSYKIHQKLVDGVFHSAIQ